MQPTQPAQPTKGSTLILTLVAVLILSILAVSGLTVSTTEVSTSQNFYLSKVSFYTAVEGVQRIIEDIKIVPDPNNIVFSEEKKEDQVDKKIISGSLEDLQDNTPENISSFDSFTPPPLPGLFTGSQTTVYPVIWKVPVSTEIKAGGKKAYSEILVGVYSFQIIKE